MNIIRWSMGKVFFAVAIVTALNIFLLTLSYRSKQLKANSPSAAATSSTSSLASPLTGEICEPKAGANSDFSQIMKQFHMREQKQEERRQRRREKQKRQQTGKAPDDHHPPKYNDLALTVFFTTKEDPQRFTRHLPASFFLYRQWYDSVIDNSMRGIVFFDEIDFYTIIGFSTPNIKFQQTRLGQRTTNDERFFTYLNYLKDNYFASETGDGQLLTGSDDNSKKNDTVQAAASTEAVEDGKKSDGSQPSQVNQRPEFVIMTDLYDVEFLKNPFDYFRLVEQQRNRTDLIFVGSEGTNENWMKDRAKQCQLEHMMQPIIDNKPLMVNAGIVGGRLEVVYEFLQRITRQLSKGNVAANCNNLVFNYVILEEMKDRYVTGGDFHNRFGSNCYSESHYVKHK